MFIYKITNNINNKVYVGQTARTFEGRMAEHQRHSRTAIDKAIKKYGIENFTIEVIDQADSINELNKLEIKWISHYDSMTSKGYNQCIGGENTLGYNHREESKKKMSEAKKKVYLGENNPFFGKTHSDNQKAKWSKARKGRDMSKVTEASFEKTRRKVINLDTEEIFNSIQDAADEYNLKHTHISRVCRGGRKTTGGYRWAYFPIIHDNTVPSLEIGRCND